MAARLPKGIDGALGADPPRDADLARRLDRRLQEEQASQKLPSIVAGLARGGALVWWSSAGSTGVPGDRRPDRDTQYRIGSISKTFVAVSVMRLRDEGALDLTDALGAHVPELAGLPVTLAQLLSHTSGLRAETPAPWWERVPGAGFAELVSCALRPSDLLWRPGRRFHYSNVGYAVLGELVARRRGTPFRNVVEDELLAPLGMTRTTWRPVAPHADGLAVHPHADLVHSEPEHDAGAMAPAGQLWSTVSDLARWSAVLAGERPEILAPPTAAEMAEPVGVADLPGQPWISAYGLGLQLVNKDGRRRVGHGGGMPGHWSMLLVDQSTGDVVVALANSTYRGSRPELSDDLLALLAAGAPRPVDPFVPGPAADSSVAALLGTWYWGPVEHRLDLGRGGRLELRGVVAGRDCDFVPGGDGTYVGQSGYFSGERLQVRRRDDGSPSHLDVASFVFKRTPYDPAVDVPGGLDPRGWHAPGPGGATRPPASSRGRRGSSARSR